MPVRYIWEPRGGKSCAYNAALSQARGAVLLCTDDDVRVPEEWVRSMCAPILRGEADAVAGPVHLAPGLHREWMTALHRACLACTEGSTDGPRIDLVGANMAIGRHVLGRVPAFDEALGPGVVGGGEDTLFGRQVREAGYTVVRCTAPPVVHYLDPVRLCRAAWRRMAQDRGAVLAYLRHHWEHAVVEHAVRRLVRALRDLAVLRIRRSRQWHWDEGMPAWEIEQITRVEYYRAHLHARRERHRYAKHGLVRLHGATTRCPWRRS